MAKYFSDQSYLYNKQTFEQLPISSRTDKQFVLKCVARNGLLYSLLSTELKEDEDIILCAIKQDSDIFPLLPGRFKTDTAFVKKLVEQNFSVFAFLPDELRSERELVFKAISEEGIDALRGMPISVFQDVEIMVTAIKSHNGTDDFIWDSILCAAGEEAEASKNLIQSAYEKYGEDVLSMSLAEIQKNKN